MTYKDGRLRTGRVAVAVFFVLLMVLAIIFQLRRPMDHALVAVKHVFEPQIEPAPAEDKQSEFNKAVAKIPEPVTIEDKPTENPKPLSPTSRPVEEEKKPEVSKEQPISRSDTTEEVPKISRKNTQTQAVEPETSSSDVDTSQQSGENSTALVDKTDSTPKAKLPEEKRINIDVSDKLKHVASWGEKPKALPKVSISSAVTDMKTPVTPPETNNSEGVSFAETTVEKDILRADKTTHESKPEKPEKRINMDVSDKLKKFSDKEKTSKESPKTDTPLGIKAVVSETEKSKPMATRKNQAKNTATKKPLMIDRTEGSITVSSKDYMSLFKTWQKTGVGGVKKEKIPLRVENLRSAYSLFQMKPVAVVNDTLFFDLLDGSRIPEAALEDYSSTIFRVNHPWRKWRNALEAAGIRESDTTEIRYYMYGFVRNAMFVRANQAFTWCKENGLIDAQMLPSDVDVLGRAYVIRQQNGGRFGVFVPISLDIKGGRTVKIDPDCYKGQPDVHMLRTAGLI